MRKYLAGLGIACVAVFIYVGIFKQNLFLTSSDEVDLSSSGSQENMTSQDKAKMKNDKKEGENIDASVESLTKDKMPLSAIEDEFSVKFYDREKGTQIRSSALRDMSLSKFDRLLNSLINNGNSDQDVTLDTNLYSEAFVKESATKSDFSLKDLACGEAICVASIEYFDFTNLDALPNRIKKMKGFDSRAVAFVGNSGDFKNTSRLGIIFTRGAGPGSFLIPASETGRISFSDKKLINNITIANNTPK